MNDEPLNCPFCGCDEPTMNHKMELICPNCRARGPQDFAAWGFKEDGAPLNDVGAWNRRRQLEELEDELSKRHAELGMLAEDANAMAEEDELQDFRSHQDGIFEALEMVRALLPNDQALRSVPTTDVERKKDSGI